MGCTSNHCILQAQLIIKNKKYGVQNFIVPTRDIKTHKPLKGVTLGDIGSKYGYNTKDNGYLILDNVRIPHDHMLSKYFKVLPDGTIQKSGDDKIWHATM